MADKKDRGRFTIKFNENDPSHAAVIELLEKQGSHSKAQFIANAILHYVRDLKMPESPPAQAVDRTTVEEIVLDILKKQGVGEQRMDSMCSICKNSEGKPAVTKSTRGQENNIPKAVDVDTSMYTLIADTMSAFRGQ